MGRNNEDFEGQKVYHASWRSNRDRIEQEGLKASQPWESQPKGVYVGKGPGTTKGYGDDIYEITVPHNEELTEDEMEHGAHIVTRDIPTTDFKRVGHVFTHRGLTEVHMHPAEECDRKSIYE